MLEGQIGVGSALERTRWLPHERDFMLTTELERVKLSPHIRLDPNYVPSRGPVCDTVSVDRFASTLKRRQYLL